MGEIVEYVVNESSFFTSKEITSTEYTRLCTWFKKTFPQVTITRIEKIQNKHQYTTIKTKQTETENCSFVSEVVHSTYADYLPSIIKNNLDWRLVKRSRYDVDKVFAVRDTLTEKKRWVSDNADIYPRCFFDTYVSKNGQVFIKFDDFTYRPKYAIHYKKPDHKTSLFHDSRLSLDIWDDDFFFLI